MYFFRVLRAQLKSLTKSFRRFPLAMLSAIFAAIFFHVALLNANTSFELQAYRWALVFLVGFFLCLDAYLFIESLRSNLKNRTMAIAITWLLVFLGLGEIFIRLIPRNGNLFQTIDLAIFYFGLFLVFSVMVFFMGTFSMEEGYVNYVMIIITNIAIAFIYSVVLFVGLSFIVLALNILLDIFERSYIYQVVAIYSFIPFMASIFLTNFPRASEDYSQLKILPTIKSLIKYIFIPLLILYTGVLYTYLAKIIFSSSLLNNSIVNLIFWSQLIAVFALFITQVIKEDKFISGFRKLYPIISIPLLILMYYALYLRIQQYGITENRYGIIVFGIWILISMVFFILQRDKDNYYLLPQILAVLIAITVIGGPLSASDISLRSQEKRLLTLLQNNNMLRGNEIVKATDLDIDSQYEITQILTYMLEHFNVENIELLEQDFRIEDMQKVFGFEAQYNTGEVYMADDSLSYSLDGRKALNIAGYNEMIRVDGSETKSLSDKFVINRDTSLIRVSRIDENSKLIEFATIDLNLVREKLSTLKNATYDIQPDDLVIEGENLGLAYKIYFTELYFPYREKPNDGMETCSFILLIKEMEGK